MRDISELPEIPFDSFAPQLETACTALANRLDREWPAVRSSHQGTPIVLRQLLLSSHNTFRSIRRLCAELPKAEAASVEHSLSVPPLARTILEGLFTTVLLFQDLGAYTTWYFKAGWRELREERDRITAKHGADPAWQDWIARHAIHVENARVQWGISASEALDVSSIKRWPIPDRMARVTGLDPHRASYMRYLGDWFYRRLSQDAHLSWPGLARRTAALIERERGEEWQQLMRKYRSDCMGTSVTLLLSHASEVEAEMKFGHAQQLRYVWGIVCQIDSTAKEIYDQRYAERL